MERLALCATFVSLALAASGPTAVVHREVALSLEGEIESTKIIRREGEHEDPRLAVLSRNINLLLHNETQQTKLHSFLHPWRFHGNSSNSPHNATSLVMVMPTWKDVQASTANAHFMVFWGLPAVFSLFFMMSNSSEENVRAMTWKVLSGAVSLGCTALLFQAFKMFWYLTFGISMALKMHTTVDFFKLLLIMFLAPRLMKHFWTRPLLREAFTIMGGHFIGFASIQFAQSLLTQTPYWKSPANCFGGMILLITVNAALMVCNRYYRWHLLKNWQEDEVTWKVWMDQCDHMENEAMGLHIGFVMSIFVRFAVVGFMPGVAGYPPYQTATQVDVLLLISIPFAVFACLSIALVRKYKEGIESRPLFKRVLDTFKACMVLSAGWLFFFYVQWQAYYMTVTVGVYGTESDNIAASMMSVFVAAFLVTALIFLYNYVGQRWEIVQDDGILRDITMVFVLMLGFAWETTMSIAVQGVSGQFGDVSNSQANFIFIFLMLIVNATFIPMWTNFILPRTLSEKFMAGAVPEEKLPLKSSDASDIPGKSAVSSSRRAAARSAKAGVSQDVSEFNPDDKGSASEPAAQENTAAEKEENPTVAAAPAPPSESVANRRSGARAARSERVAPPPTDGQDDEF